MRIPSSEIDATKPRERISNHAAGLHRHSVLVAEDHDDTRVMLKTVLEINNFEVLEAANGVEAVRLTKSLHPDLILMDLTLPLIDGLTATRLIRASNLSCTVPIIFLSGHAEPAPQQAAREAGCNAYLVKPVPLDEMIKVIKRTLVEKPSFVEGVTELGGSDGLRAEGNARAV